MAKYLKTKQKEKIGTFTIESGEESIDSQPEISDTNTMPNSRLRKKVENHYRNVFILTLIGLIILVAALLLYGPSLLINFSVQLGNLGKNTSSSDINKDSHSFIPAPILDSQTSATNSANIKITGQSSLNEKDDIKLYVNNELADVTHPKKNGSFSFDSVELKEGANLIKAVAFVKNDKSDDSNILTISYIKDAPELTINEPQDGQSFSGDNKTITVKGKTNPTARVTVNDHIAVIKNDGSYFYTMTLQNGDNKIKVISSDEAGNKTEKEITVKAQ